MSRGLAMMMMAASLLGWGSAAQASGFQCTPQAALWQFHASVPLSGPPLVARPRSNPGELIIYLGSHEGYVHALRGDGRFLWSYTVKGALMLPLSLDANGSLFATSSWGRLYSFRADGGLNWLYRSPITPESALALSPRGAIFFTRGDQLFAASKGGGLLWRAALGARAVAGPLVSASGRAWVLTDAGTIQGVIRPSERRKWITGRRGAGRLLVGKKRLYVAQGGRLQVYDLRGKKLWSHGQAWVALGPKNTIVLAGPQGVAWLNAKTGAEVYRVKTPLEVSARPVVLGEHVLVPLRGGELWVGSRKTSQRCNIAGASLLTPNYDPPSRQVVIGASDGSVVAFHWPWAT